MKTLEHSFFEKTKRVGDCFIWYGSKFKSGYGRIRIKGKIYRANRVAFLIKKGEIPNGFCICHSCDNPSCVNPDHLFLGTHKENMDDMSIKTRFYSPLNKNQVLEIRKSRLKTKELSNVFSVSIQTIKNIRNKKTWKFV
jgi:HNH endonuclease